MSRGYPSRRLLTLLFAVALAAVLVGSVSPTPDAGVPDWLGEVDGTAHDDPLSVTVEDGLEEDELDALVTRSMARIEVIRGLAFEEPVDVEIVTREEYREQRGGDVSEFDRTWENLRWEALFVVGQDRDATAVLDEAFAEGVQGLYLPGEERVVIVSDDSDEPTVDKGTLVHELVHALQHQQFGLDSDAETTDERRARDGVIEGEAELVPDLYLDRCGVLWSCVLPEDDLDTTETELGIQVALLAPYVQGVEFVEAIRDRGGWAAVDALHDEFPESTTQIIHPERYPDDSPTTVTVPDRSSPEWTRLDTADLDRADSEGFDGDSGNERAATDTLGEAAIYAMLVHNDVADVDDLLGYEHAFSTGWTGDQFVPYERDGEFGYVWETAWESDSDAEQFAFAYREVLDRHGAVETDDDLFVVPGGPFEGAFRVTQDRTTVRIVNAPTANELDGIHG